MEVRCVPTIGGEGIERGCKEEFSSDERSFQWHLELDLA